MEYAPATVDAIWLAKVRQARTMTEEERVLAGPRLFSGVCRRMKEGIRDENPTATEGMVHDLLLGRLAKLRKIQSGRPAVR